MDLAKDIKHNFNLSGMKQGSEFLGCPCGFHLNPGQATKPICPDCGKKLLIYKVTNKDVEPYYCSKIFS